MITNVMIAVTHAPKSRPYGVHALKSGSPPILPTIPRIRSTVAVTTAANAPAMMNATASSTRLPRRMKFLNPLMPGTLVGEGERDEGADRGARDASDIGRVRADHDQPPGQPGRRSLRGPVRDCEHGHVARDGAGAAALRVGGDQVDPVA